MHELTGRSLHPYQPSPRDAITSQSVALLVPYPITLMQEGNEIPLQTQTCDEENTISNAGIFLRKRLPTKLHSMLNRCTVHTSLYRNLGNKPKALPLQRVAVYSIGLVMGMVIDMGW